MKLLAPITCLILLHATIGLAADGDQKSALIRDGALQTIKEPVAKILQFKIRDGKLQLDRAAWEPAAREIEKEEAAGPKLPAGIAPNTPEALRFQARRLEDRARKMEILGRMGTPPPIYTIYRRIEAVAESQPNQFRYQPGYSMQSGGEWRSAFRTDNLESQIRTKGNATKLTLEELLDAKRCLELTAESDSCFRIELANAAEDSILIHQSPDGRFSVVVMQNGSVRAIHGATFIALFKENRKWMETEILPVFLQFGISLIGSAESSAVRNAVLLAILRSPVTTREGERLIADLNSNSYQDRERAGLLLNERFELYRESIQKALADKPESYEVQARLEQIVAQHANSTAMDTAEALDLLHDASFIVSLFELAKPDELPKIIGHLEKTTEQSVGNDPAAWKQWIRSKN